MGFDGRRVVYGVNKQHGQFAEVIRWTTTKRHLRSYRRCWIPVSYCLRDKYKSVRRHERIPVKYYCDKTKAKEMRKRLWFVSKMTTIGARAARYPAETLSGISGNHRAIKHVVDASVASDAGRTAGRTTVARQADTNTRPR